MSNWDDLGILSTIRLMLGRAWLVVIILVGVGGPVVIALALFVWALGVLSGAWS